MPTIESTAREPAPAAWKDEVSGRLDELRRRTLALIAPLSDADLTVAARDFMSPLAWDLNHVADFERLWLIDAVNGSQSARLERRFDAAEVPRTERAGLELPLKADSVGKMARVRAEVLSLLATVDPESEEPLLRDGFVYRMVLQHEAQHQETMLQALNLAGLGLPADDRAREPAAAQVDDRARVTVPGGPFMMGTADRTYAYDNERPTHEVDVAEFEIDRYPVTNARWCAFLEDGGYQRPNLWSIEGQRWLGGAGEEPLPGGWRRRGAELVVERFGAEQPLAVAEPVQHVCFWEAEAFARWSGGRLPSEAEWEKAAAWDEASARARIYPWGDEEPVTAGAVREPNTARDSGPAPFGGCGPERVGRRPELASAHGVEDLHGSVYNWTASAFSGYPGFEPFPYREYSEVFFGDTYRVLRGSSWAAHPLLWRNTYRNWDLPHRRQLFAGVRVAYDR